MARAKIIAFRNTRTRQTWKTIDPDSEVMFEFEDGSKITIQANLDEDNRLVIRELSTRKDLVIRPWMSNVIKLL